MNAIDPEVCFYASLPDSIVWHIWFRMGKHSPIFDWGWIKNAFQGIIGNSGVN